MAGRKLTDELADRIFEEKRELLRSIGMDEIQVSAAMVETEEQYRTYKRTFELKDAGIPNKDIVSELGVDPASVIHWTANGIIPVLFDQKTCFSKRGMQFRDDNERDVSILLGAYAAKRFSPPLATGEASFDMSSLDKKVLEDFLPHIFNVFSIVPSIYTVDEDRRWKFVFRSKKWARFYNEHTDNNGRVPWQLLDSEEKKADYFTGYFARKGSITSYGSEKKRPRIVFSFIENTTLKTDFSLLLLDLGMVPRYGGTRVELSDYVDLKKIIDNGWCMSEKRLGQLTYLFDGIEKREEPIPPNELSQIIQRVADGELDREEAIERYGLPRSRVNSWLFKRSVPYRIIRYREIKSWEQKSGDRYLLRLGVDVATARSLSQAFSLEEIIQFRDLQSIDRFLGNQIFDEKIKSPDCQDADVVMWRKLHLESPTVDSEKNTPYLRLGDVFNMFVPEQHLTNEEMVKRYHLQCYRSLRMNIRFSECVYVEDGELYVARSRFDLVETLLGSAGMGMKRRKLEDAQRLAEEHGWYRL